MARLDWLAVKEIPMVEACDWADESGLLNINAWEPKLTECWCFRPPVAFAVPERMLYVVVRWQTVFIFVAV